MYIIKYSSESQAVVVVLLRKKSKGKYLKKGTFKKGSVSGFKFVVVCMSKCRASYSMTQIKKNINIYCYKQ